MNATSGLSRGTVADRVQKFQNSLRGQDHSVPRPRSPLIDIPAEESQTQVGRGRRQESSFGPPASRTSRDGPDGARGDGRPPVGSAAHHLSPSLLPLPVLSPRAATSMAVKPSSHDDPFLVPGTQNRPLQEHASMDSKAEPQAEIARARSRLKSITKRMDPNQHASPKRAYTLAELNDMLDDAIEAHATMPPTAAPREASLQPTVIRRWKSERSPRRSIEGVAFHPPEESPGKARSQARPSTSHGGRSTSARSPRQRWPPGGLPLSRQDLGQGLRFSSPVKQRALMFETKEQNLNYVSQPCEAPHEPHIHMKEDWSVVPLHEPSEQNEKDLHPLKFGMTMYKPAKIPTGPPASAQVEHTRKKPADSSTDETFDTAIQSSETADLSDQHNQPLVGHARKTSKGWPFKWRMFSKASSVPPGANEDTTVATPQIDDHYSSARPSIVRRKVQELLKREEEEQSRRQVEAAHKGRRASRRPSVVKESELREPRPNPLSLSPAQLPPLQLPVQEEADLILPSYDTMTAMPAEAKVKRTISGKPSTTPMTPIHRSWAEKEVTELSEPRSDTAFLRSGSPVKPGPSTPMRGRSMKMRHSLSPRGSPYMTEHAFSLSPVPSGSPSRTSSPIRVHKVEVELRDSPEREARERGEKVMFVRTHAFEEAEGESKR